jgi:hypothetical protein
MSKQWYYEVMGAPVGPITSIELRDCVHTRRILPETRIRLGADGKWQTADRVKGLFDAPDASPAKTAGTPAPDKKATAAKTEAKITIAETATAEMNTVQTAEIKIQLAGLSPARDMRGTPASPNVGAAPAQADAVDDTSSNEYDFFKFVGFEEAIGTALNGVLTEYCRIHRVTMAQTTRRALAEFLGRKDLSGDPASMKAAGTPAVEAFGVS